MEMTVDAKQRLKDCRSIENGAVSGGCDGINARRAWGTGLNARRRTHEEIWGNRVAMSKVRGCEE